MIHIHYIYDKELAIGDLDGIVFEQGKKGCERKLFILSHKGKKLVLAAVKGTLEEVVEVLVMSFEECLSKFMDMSLDHQEELRDKLISWRFNSNKHFVCNIGKWGVRICGVSRCSGGYETWTFWWIAHLFWGINSGNIVGAIYINTNGIYIKCPNILIPITSLSGSFERKDKLTTFFVISPIKQ
ncbi:hypothetical protein SELMODRAFT_415345 [Selaginella moellendorffii]|uniref:Uncharacterized protein n=1 Tax=Selaginella moellendorffii TaxID=88036 RepID=D8RVU1_SELML|nr:hypothetical protein SELMODRAFT_415345 [Selaginella moellendorffii]